MADLDMAKVREAREWLRTHTMVSPKSHAQLAEWQATTAACTRTLASYAKHIMDSGAVVVPAEDFKAAIRHLEAYQRELGEVWSEELDEQRNDLERTIDRLVKLGEA